jgi:oxygen-dependent protoporphyrinogen oxidase
MRGKLLFVTGAAVGYVLGTRAGRKRYEQIKSAATKVWESPGIQKQVNAVEDLVAAKVGDVPGALYEGAKKLVGQVAGRQKNQSSSLVVRPDTSPAVPSNSAAKPAPEDSGDTGA